MADIETVVKRLIEFNAEALRRVRGIGSPSQVQQAPSSSSKKTPEVQVFEACIARLDDAERAELERLIEKMMPGAREP